MNKNLAAEFYRAGLSKRQIEVAHLVLSGLTNSEIAKILFVTDATIKFHIGVIYKALVIKSRAQFFVWAISKLGDDKVDVPKVDEKGVFKIRSPDELPSGEQN